MYLAHTGVALGAKAADQRVPLVWLLVAAWAFDITGVGHWVPVGLLLAAAALVLGRRRWGPRAGLVLFAVVATHDVVDLVVGVQLFPGGRFIGWDPGPGSGGALALELAVLIVGSLLYWRTLPDGGRRAPVIGGLALVLGASIAESLVNRTADEAATVVTLAALGLGALLTAVVLVRADRVARDV